MTHKIFTLLIILFCSLSGLSSQNGITVKLLKPEAAGLGFPGGEEALYKYFADNLLYPSLLIEIEMEGDVQVRFTVNEEGVAENIEILRGFDPLADDQIVQAISKMPRWASRTESVELLFDFKLNDDLRNRLEEIRKEEEKKAQTAALAPQEDRQPQPEEEASAKSDTLLNRMPEFPGGQKALDEYIKTNLKYPKKAIDLNIEGRAVFNLSVAADGEITKIELYKGVYYECNEEAYYLIKRMPKWTPGLRDGKPAAMDVLLPIPFVLPRGTAKR